MGLVAKRGYNMICQHNHNNHSFWHNHHNTERAPDVANLTVFTHATKRGWQIQDDMSA